jgi:hypothetical protein
MNCAPMVLKMFRARTTRPNVAVHGRDAVAGNFVGGDDQDRLRISRRKCGRACGTSRQDLAHQVGRAGIALEQVRPRCGPALLREREAVDHFQAGQVAQLDDREAGIAGPVRRRLALPPERVPQSITVC